MKTLSPVQGLSLFQLSKKLTLLLALLYDQQKQGLHLLDFRNIAVRENMLIIRYGDLLKQSRPRHHLDEISIAAYTNTRNIDPMIHVLIYVQCMCIRNILV